VSRYPKGYRKAADSCNSCLAWGVFSGRLCPTCYMFARSREAASCEGCRRPLPLKWNYCRLCWCQARLNARTDAAQAEVDGEVRALDLLSHPPARVVRGPPGLAVRQREDRSEPFRLVLDVRQGPVDRVGGDLGMPLFLRPAGGHPPRGLHRGDGQPDVIGQPLQRRLDRPLPLPYQAAPLPHRLDLQSTVTDRELPTRLLLDHIPQLGNDLLVTGLADAPDFLDCFGHGASPPTASQGTVLGTATGQGPLPNRESDRKS
jgi:hypothetical protein